MAGNERLSYEIAAIYSGSPEIQKAFKDFAALNAQGQKVVNQLDKLAKASRDAGGAIRESRQGAGQLGMQFNQFATQIGSGTSALTAFQQQIGDVGYALSFMGGTAGRVGAFLAGPWGAGLIIATSVLSAFWSTMNKSDEVSKKFENAMDRAKDALFDYRVEIATTRDELVSLYETKLAQIEIDWRKASTDIGMYGGEVQKTQRILDRWASTPLWKVTKAYFENKDATEKYQKAAEGEKALYADMMNAQTALIRLKKGFAREDEAAANKANRSFNSQVQRSNTLMEMLSSEINAFTSETTAIGKAKNRLDEFNRSVKELGNLPGGKAFLDANATALQRVTIALNEGANGVTEWNKVIAKSNEKQLPEWHRRLNEINEAYGNLNATIAAGSPVQADRSKAITGIALGELDKIAKKAEEMGNKSIDPVQQLRNELLQLEGVLSGGLFEGADFDAVTERINQIRDSLHGLEIDKRNEEYKKSFQTLGESVSSAFKNMLTAGASWKDGMKGIIQTVIDELWRLFVVQQIVGMVTNAFSGAFGGGSKSSAGSVMSNVGASINKVIGKNANGTNNWRGGLSWVGERGPELVNLPRGSQVIPAHRASQMGGGGVVVNVDARGSADPAAVRAQVQQGILEAAPAIVAAAHQRTVAGLRRPKLGGVMQ